jgi:methylated-DNA-protein-cysteine methyltransferase-like protein
MPSPFARIKADVLAVVRAVPAGRVTTYGAVGRHLGVTPRHVAAVMATLTDEEAETVPWYRVVGANGVVSAMKRGRVGREQIARLEAEGIDVTARNVVLDFKSVLWLPE